MAYRRLGRTGLKLSEIGLGSWLTYGAAVDRSVAEPCISKALELGINLFDTADVYADGEAERLLGSILSAVPRKDYVLASKCYFPVGSGPNDQGLSRKHIFDSLHASLRRLRTEYIDIYQCHRFDEETPLEETACAMDDLVRHGKVLYWGVSRWSAAQIADMVSACGRNSLHPPCSNQPPFNLLERSIELDVLPACRQFGLGVLAYSPLAQGVLTGKYSQGRRPPSSRATQEGASVFMKKYLTVENLAAVDALRPTAAEAGMSLAQLALAWCLRLPEISAVLVGATSPAQIEENARAAGRPITSDLAARIEAVFAHPPLTR
ncbi:MAG: aldo/keto reductase family protein [Planctomycetota bacterium]